jgi:hypothetical protein
MLACVHEDSSYRDYWACMCILCGVGLIFRVVRLHINILQVYFILLIIVRVVTIIVDLHGKGRSGPLGRWLYHRGYSTTIAIYCISTSLSIVGFSLMMWVYSSMLSLGGRTDYGHEIWRGHFHAGFGFLTILVRRYIFSDAQRSYRY